MEIQGDRMLSYAGMSDAELNVELAIGNVESAVNSLESAVKAVESEADDAELDVVQMKDTAHAMRVKKILDNLKSKYPNRNLTRKEFQNESSYTDSKTSDFLVIYESFDKDLIALRLAQDIKDRAREAANHKRLVKYLSCRYSGYQACPIECLELETQTPQKEAVKTAKKMMGLKPTAKLLFVDFSIVADIIMEDLL